MDESSRPGPAILPAVLASRSVSTTCFCFILGRSESKNKVVCKWPTGKLRLVSRGFFVLLYSMCLFFFCLRKMKEILRSD